MPPQGTRLTVNDICRVTGYSRTAVSEWRKSPHFPKRGADNKWDADEVLDFVRARVIQPPAHSGEARQVAEGLRLAKIREITLRCAKLEMDNQRRRNELVSRALVRADIALRCNALKQTLAASARKLAATLGGRSPAEIELALLDELNSALTAFNASPHYNGDIAALVADACRLRRLARDTRSASKRAEHEHKLGASLDALCAALERDTE